MSSPDPADRRSLKTAMQLDELATPARYKLTQPFEVPQFGVDEGDRPFATATDREERGDEARQKDTPLTIRESKPTE